MKNTSYTDKIQAITATAAFMLSIVVLWQESRIKTLTDVVDELSNITRALANQTSELENQTTQLGSQTTELGKQAISLSEQTEIMTRDYQLQLTLAKAQLLPVIRLKDRHLVNAGGPTFRVLLENIGTPAHNVEFTPVYNMIDIVVDGPNQLYSFGTVNNWDLQVTRQHEDRDFTFQMSWESDNGDTYTQLVKGINMKLFIDPAKLISKSKKK